VAEYNQCRKAPVAMDKVITIGKGALI
jgi:hypothetical protein